MKTHDRTKYVKLLPNVYEMTKSKLIFGNECVSFHSNMNEMERCLVSQTSLLPSVKTEYEEINTKCIGSLYAMRQGHLIKTNDIADVNMISVNDERYIPGADNATYYDDDVRIQIMHHPYVGMTHCCRAQNIYTSISGSEVGLIMLARKALKQLIVNHNKKLGMFSLHTAAVSRADKIALILGGSHASKTTIFMNLSLNGYTPLNDDFIFIGHSGSAIEIKNYRILPSVRKDSLRFINNIERFMIGDSTNGFQGEFYVDVWEKSISYDYLKDKTISVIFLPEYGHNVLKIYEADKVLSQKKVLKSLSGFQELSANTGLLNLMRYLLSIPVYEVKLTENMEEFVDMFSNFTECKGYL